MGNMRDDSADILFFLFFFFFFLLEAIVSGSSVGMGANMKDPTAERAHTVLSIENCPLLQAVLLLDCFHMSVCPD